MRETHFSLSDSPHICIRLLIHVLFKESSTWFRESDNTAVDIQHKKDGYESNMFGKINT